MSEKPVCGVCGRARGTSSRDYDYHYMQPFSGTPVGWYSGDDGEICGNCLERLLGEW